MISQPTFLSLDEILQIHSDMIATFGGSDGVRDMGPLESALHGPQASFGGDYLHPEIASMAAAYLFHIAKNHAFVDGNKRTAATAAITFLKMNQIPFAADQMKLAELTERVAADQATKEDAIDFFRKNIEESE